MALNTTIDFSTVQEFITANSIDSVEYDYTMITSNALPEYYLEKTSNTYSNSEIEFVFTELFKDFIKHSRFYLRKNFGSDKVSDNINKEFNDLLSKIDYSKVNLRLEYIHGGDTLALYYDDVDITGINFNPHNIAKYINVPDNQMWCVNSFMQHLLKQACHIQKPPNPDNQLLDRIFG